MSFVARACPGVFAGAGMTAERYIRYFLPQERGWSYVHTHLLAEGMPMRWPKMEDNRKGRWWMKLMQRLGL